MKTKILTLVILFGLTATVMYADNDKPITFEQLPEKAQTLINTNFTGIKVAFAKVDNDLFGKEYEVLLTDGTKVEFAGNGEWKSIDCRYTAVPEALIPVQIKSYVSQNYPGTKIIEIERDRHETEVKITTGFELTFNQSYVLIDIDD